MRNQRKLCVLQRKKNAKSERTDNVTSLSGQYEKRTIVFRDKKKHHLGHVYALKILNHNFVHELANN